MIRILLSPLAFLYGLVVGFRHKLFDWGVFKSEEFDIPIVCVGNLTVGGTGKTPVAEFLVDHLSCEYNVALLSRGYRRKTKGYIEASVHSSFREVGDEPKQIKLKFPDIVVSVCEKRADGIRRILADHPEVNLIILDDGFQHRHVEPWVNIVLMDYSRPIYRDHLLPWGSLRDTVNQLYRAHFVIVTKCPPDLNPLDMRIVTKSLNLYPYQGLYFSGIASGSVTPLFPDMATDKVFSDTPVIAMAGIGNPAPMIGSLEENYEVVDTLIFPDHHTYRMRDLEKMKKALTAAPQGTIIVTTEKDAVKLTNRKKIPAEIQRALYFLPIKIVMAEECQEHFLRKLDYDVRSNQKYGLLHSQ